MIGGTVPVGNRCPWTRGNIGPHRGMQTVQLIGYGSSLGERLTGYENLYSSQPYYLRLQSTPPETNELMAEVHTCTSCEIALRLLDLTLTNVNSLRAKFFRGNINIYLHFVSLIHIDMTQVLKILPRVREGPIYPILSISWLLMSWLRKEPGHQQPWYWPT